MNVGIVEVRNSTVRYSIFCGSLFGYPESPIGCNFVQSIFFSDKHHSIDKSIKLSSCAGLHIASLVSEQFRMASLGDDPALIQHHDVDPSRSRSISRCVISSRVRPAVCCFKACIIFFSVSGSRPSVGSSSTHNGALCNMARATATRRACPPDKKLTGFTNPGVQAVGQTSLQSQAVGRHSELPANHPHCLPRG